MILFALFIASGLTMVLLVLHKHMEITYGKGLIMRRLAHSADGRVRIATRTVRKVTPLFKRRYLARFIHMVIIVLARAIIATSRWIHGAIYGTRERFSKNEPQILGEGASMYVKQISETKDVENE